VSQRLIGKGRTIWIADAHRDDGKRFVVRADLKNGRFSKTVNIFGATSFGTNYVLISAVAVVGGAVFQTTDI